METGSETCSIEETSETCSSEGSSKFTTVKTAYARAAVFLLAINFCLTGYVVYNMNQTTQEQIDGITGAENSTTTSQTTTQQATTTSQQPTETTSTEVEQGTTSSPVTTREQ